MANTSVQGALLLFFCASTILSKQAAAVTCQQVFSGIAGCVAYGRGAGAAPPPGCCSGVRSLNSQFHSTPDRQQGCRCIQSIIKSLPGVNLDRAASIPAKCGVNVGFPIDLSFDCSKVK